MCTFPFYYPLTSLKSAGEVANREDPDQTPRSAASDLGLAVCADPSVRIRRFNTVTQSDNICIKSLVFAVNVQNFCLSNIPMIQP